MMAGMDDDQLDRVFSAVADPTRRRIVDRLHKRSEQTLFEVCAGSIAEDGTSLSRQAISRHLDVLEAAGLVTTSWKGRTKIHSLNTEPLVEATNSWLKQYLERQHS